MNFVHKGLIYKKPRSSFMKNKNFTEEEEEEEELKNFAHRGSELRVWIEITLNSFMNKTNINFVHQGQVKWTSFM